LRVAFAGTPRFAAVVLKGLLASVHEVGLVISQPDARRGRGRKVARTPVSEFARSRGVPLAQPQRISGVAEEISRHDVLVVAAYGQILTPDVLEAAPYGAYNVHASLLPAYRGAAPVERAIMNGEEETGVSIMKMDEGLDTGPVALREKVPIGPETTGGELTEELARVGAGAMVRALDMLQAGELEVEEQNHSRATYAKKISPEDRVIDWKRSAKQIHDHIRALSPHIGARTAHPDVRGPVKILRSRVYERETSLGAGEIQAGEKRILVGCGEGAIEVLRLQLPGGKVLCAEEFLRGHDLAGAFGR
jgi:methionyl-tRNA formyltransferase